METIKIKSNNFVEIPLGNDKVQFNHINDCWNYLRKAKNREDLESRIEDLPNWSGSWLVEKGDYNNCLVINLYEDDEDKEDLDIEY